MSNFASRLHQRFRTFSRLLDVELPSLPTESNRLARAFTYDDFYRLAQARTPRFVLDYVDGGAGMEAAVDGNSAAFARTRLIPRTAQAVNNVSTATTLFGREYALPVGIPPIGLTGLMRAEAEDAGAQAAANAGVAFTLSTMGTRSIEDIAAASPSGAKWFQLYLCRQREDSFALVERAKAAGFEALVVTVDTRVSGRRYRDERNQLSMPPRLNARSAVQSALHPAWTKDLLQHEAPTLANFAHSDAPLHELVNSMFDPLLDTADIAELRRRWPGPIIIKGVMDPADAQAFIDVGADGIWVSNHGGRQLDRALAPLDAVGAIRAAVGEDVPVLIDSGLRSGTDVVTAIAAGADAAFLGRGYLYSLIAGGHAGVERYFELLKREIHNAMTLLATPTVAELRRQGPELLAHAANS